MHKGLGDYLLVLFALFTVTFVILPKAFWLILWIIVIIWIILILIDEKKYWARQGLDGPAPNLLLGNMLEVRDGLHVYDQKMFQKFGKTFGSYVYSLKEIVTMDLDLLNKIFKLQKEYFIDRFYVVTADSKNHSAIIRSMLPLQQGIRWKQTRKRSAKAYSPSYIQRMLTRFNECAFELCDAVNNMLADNMDISIKDLMQKFSLTVTARTAFGLDINAFDAENADFVKYGKQFQNDFNFFSPKVILLSLFTTTATYIERYFNYECLSNGAAKFFKKILNDLYNERVAMKQRDEIPPEDFLQLLLDAEEEFKVKSQGQDNYKPEMMGQLFQFLLAGFDTTSFASEMVLYVLSKLPDIQQKVRHEIEEVIGDKKYIEYKDLVQLKYMNQVIMETLRMYPPAARLNMVCVQDVDVDHIKFTKGSMISTSVYCIHYNPELYPNPYEFNPDRFTDEARRSRHKLAYLPFGFGLRNCIGQKFAEMQIRMTLSHLLSCFEFYGAENSPELPVEIMTKGTTKSTKELFVRVRPLNRKRYYHKG